MASNCPSAEASGNGNLVRFNLAQFSEVELQALLKHREGLYCTILMGYIGTIGYILGLYWGVIGIMEKKMETTILYYT